jgi:hypothetical protein
MLARKVFYHMSHYTSPWVMFSIKRFIWLTIVVVRESKQHDIRSGEGLWLQSRRGVSKYKRPSRLRFIMNLPFL